MNARSRWRHAIVISMALNILLLWGIGILSAGIFQPEPVEQLIELDLVSDDSTAQAVASGSSSSEQTKVSATTATSSPGIVSATPTKSSASSFVAVQEVTALSVDEVSTANLVTDDDVGTTQGRSSSPSGSTSGSSTVGGGSGQSSNGGSKGGQGSGSGSGNSGGGIIGPKILSQVDPTYPESARQAGVAGTVILKVQILENGRAGAVSVKQSSGNDLLDESATAAVYKWRFTPAQEKNTGRALGCYITLPVEFRLN